jgi:CheY-like chemotaxis protein
VRIMLVDDHAAFRQMVKTVLAALAADFVGCKDGQEAVAEYPRFRPNVVQWTLR